MAFKDLKNLREIASGTTLVKDITGTDALSGMFSVAQLAFGVTGLTKVSEVIKSRSGVGNEIRNDSELCKSADKLIESYLELQNNGNGIANNMRIDLSQILTYAETLIKMYQFISGLF